MIGRPGETELQLARLAEALRSSDPARRLAAVNRAPNHPGVLRLLDFALDDPAGEVRRAAVRALARLGGPAASGAIIRVSTQDPSPAVRAEAVTALGGLLRRRGRLRSSP